MFKKPPILRQDQPMNQRACDCDLDLSVQEAKTATETKNGNCIYNPVKNKIFALFDLDSKNFSLMKCFCSQEVANLR